MAKSTNSKKAYYLKHLYFHSFKDNREIDQVGRIEDVLSDGYVLVVIYAWLTGAPIWLKVVHLSDMKNWQLYDTKEECENFYRQYCKNREKESL